MKEIIIIISLILVIVLLITAIITEIITIIDYKKTTKKVHENLNKIGKELEEFKND